MLKNPEHFIKEVTKYIKNNCDIAVLGLSGGADSTLVACLCVEALGKGNVYGLSMPCSTSDEQIFNTRSALLAKRLKINHENMWIGDIFIAFLNQGLTNDQLVLGNLKARIRMTTLYGQANKLSLTQKGKRVRVIGTGNMSEDFIGYDTKGGDALADFFPIGSLYKSEVYQLLDYFKEQGVITEEMIDRVPSAGLWEGQTDEQELGYSYNEMEPAIRLLRGEHVDAVSKQTLDFVSDRHRANAHKHMAPPVFEYNNNISDLDMLKGLITDVLTKYIGKESTPMLFDVISEDLRNVLSEVLHMNLNIKVVPIAEDNAVLITNDSGGFTFRFPVPFRIDKCE